MKISGQWVGWGLGDISETVRKIKDKMRRKFSYTKTLADTTLFDEAMVAAVSTMQTNYNADGRLPTGKYTLGIVNAETQYVMGFLPRPPGPDTRPLLITVCGTGVPWWVGPDADVARAIEDKYKWQPIGYPAAPFPMGKSVEAGRAEAVFQCERMEPGFENRKRIEEHGLALIGYSQGAIITSLMWEHDIKGGGRLGWAKDKVRKAVTFGNPMREKGMAWPDGGGPRANMESYGIADELQVDTPPFWRNYAHEGDLYTDVEGESGENKTAIYKIIMGQKVFSGPDSILRQVLEVTGATDGSTISEVMGIFKALMDAGMFFGKGTGPHVSYGIREAIDYLRS